MSGIKKYKILGVHYGHNATAAYLEDGQIKACVSEERFNRLKNSTGWPERSMEYIKRNYSKDFDLIVLAQKYPWGYEYLKRYGFKSFAPGRRDYAAKERCVSLKTELALRIFPDFFYRRARRKMLAMNESAEADTRGLDEMRQYFSGLLVAAPEKIIFADHHLCHALSAGFFLDNPSDKTLVFTLDGEGDGLCATVSILQNGQIEILSKVNRAFSLGYLYLSVTSFLGMKPNEHEFKVMGLAPYAKKEHIAKLLPIFEKVLWLNGKDEFESRIPMHLIKYYLRENLIYQRFDNIAGAIQEFSEKIVLEWISRWVRKIGVGNIALAGGVFMNVKMNQKIGELSKVGKLTVVPSAGDETTALGACFYGLRELNQKNGAGFQADPVRERAPLTVSANDDPVSLGINNHQLMSVVFSNGVNKINNLYLGLEYSDKEIENFLRANGCFEKYKIVKSENINKEVAALLARNEAVARFFGRMEFGARALGNRSILANPSSRENVKLINEMIKNRDFWMPFAATILAEDAGRYLVNPKNIDASFMAITFDTTSEAQKDLAAAIHPYDKTSRPQVLARPVPQLRDGAREVNPGYYELIEEFKKLTGIGGVLNTSLNLHGEPNVASPADALHTFEDSGLKYLAIGSFLVSKRPDAEIARC